MDNSVYNSDFSHFPSLLNVDNFVVYFFGGSLSGDSFRQTLCIFTNCTHFNTIETIKTIHFTVKHPDSGHVTERTHTSLGIE